MQSVKGACGLLLLPLLLEPGDQRPFKGSLSLSFHGCLCGRSRTLGQGCAVTEGVASTWLGGGQG
jgi:hypothetical protein